MHLSLYKTRGDVIQLCQRDRKPLRVTNYIYILKFQGTDWQVNPGGIRMRENVNGLSSEVT